jgi:GNAT superfamily N-acetyltransferase
VSVAEHVLWLAQVALGSETCPATPPFTTPLAVAPPPCPPPATSKHTLTGCRTGTPFHTPTHSGKGIGRSLLQHLVAAADPQTAIYLTTLRRTTRFYEAAGFKLLQAGEVPW